MGGGRVEDEEGFRSVYGVGEKALGQEAKKKGKKNKKHAAI